MARFPPPPPRCCFMRFQISQFADLSPTATAVSHRNSNCPRRRFVSSTADHIWYRQRNSISSRSRSGFSRWSKEDFHCDEKSIFARTLEFKWDRVKSDGWELAKWCPRWARWCLAGAQVGSYSTEQPRRTETPASKISKTSSKMAETLPRRLPPSSKRGQN